MTTQQWLALIATLIGGGAMGAILTALITNFRNKVQSIYCVKEHISVFHQSVL